MLHIITDTRHTLAGFILADLKDNPEVNIIEFPKDKRNVWQKAIRYVEAKFGLIGQGKYLPAITREHLTTIHPSDSVLIFDIDYPKDLQIIKKHLPACKKISLFLWNPVQNHDSKLEKSLRNIQVLRKEFSNIYTFDPQDAQNHQLKWVPQPYRNISISTGTPLEKDIDLYFIGSDKGRLDQLINIQKSAESAGLKCHFHITPSKRYQYTKEQAVYLSKKHVSYEENLALARRAHCLLEIVQANQSGPTIRAMEASFLNCKLMTNRVHAQDQPDYAPDRIWVFNEVTPDGIQHFIHQPHQPPSSDALMEHDIRHWWKNFI